MEKVESLRIRVVYALPDQQASVSLQVPPGTTVAHAVTRSKLLEKFPEYSRHRVLHALNIVDNG